MQQRHKKTKNKSNLKHPPKKINEKQNHLHWKDLPWFQCQVVVVAKKPRLHPGARRRVGSRQSRHFEGERSLGKGSTVSALFLDPQFFSICISRLRTFSHRQLVITKKGDLLFTNQKNLTSSNMCNKDTKKRKTNPTSSTPPKKQRETNPSTPKRLAVVSVPSRSSCKETSASPRSTKKSWLASHSPLWVRSTSWKRRRWTRGVGGGGEDFLSVPGIENPGWRRWWNVRTFCSCLFFEMHRRCCGQPSDPFGYNKVNMGWTKFEANMLGHNAHVFPVRVSVVYWYVDGML